MNRNEMVEGIMRLAGLRKASVACFYDGFAELVRRELLRNKEFILPGLGAFRVRIRKARTGRNPQTGQVIQIPQKKVVRFRAYRSLSELINGTRQEPPAGTQEPPKDDSPGLWPGGSPPKGQ
jgi:DNA-binding protein HU-beta